MADVAVERRAESDRRRRRLQSSVWFINLPLHLNYHIRSLISQTVLSKSWSITLTSLCFCNDTHEVHMIQYLTNKKTTLISRCSPSVCRWLDIPSHCQFWPQGACKPLRKFKWKHFYRLALNTTLTSIKEVRLKTYLTDYCKIWISLLHITI